MVALLLNIGEPKKKLQRSHCKESIFKWHWLLLSTTLSFSSVSFKHMWTINIITTFFLFIPVISDLVIPLRGWYLELGKYFLIIDFCIMVLNLNLQKSLYQFRKGTKFQDNITSTIFWKSSPQTFSPLPIPIKRMRLRQAWLKKRVLSFSTYG